jgi:protein SCO1/2
MSVTCATRLAASLAAALACAGPVAAQAPDPAVPDDTDGIGIFEKNGAQLPLDLRFTDEAGKPVTLGDYFQGDRPVLMLLVYYACPGVCNALLNGLTESLRGMQWTAGSQFRIVTVSIDPKETPELARNKKLGYVGLYGRPEAADGWAYLVGSQESIEKLAATVGFGYRYQERTGLYTHAASVMVCTPGGKLSLYLNDVTFEPATLQLALTEAAQGTVGSPMQRLMLRWCYMYDPSSGRYVLAARKVMAIGGLVTVLLTAAGLGFLWWRDVGSRAGRAVEART